MSKYYHQITQQWNIIVMNWFIGSFGTECNWAKVQISIQYSRFLVSKFYVIFRLRAFFIPTIKLYKHHSLNIPPKCEFFILNLITIWAEHFTFSEALESHKGKFPSTFCPTACFYLCKISFIYWKGKKKRKPLSGWWHSETHCSGKLWSIIQGNLLWLTLLWEESLDGMISRGLFHLQVFCDCLNFDYPSWIMIRNLCHFLQYVFFFLKNTACNKSFGTFAWKWFLNIFFSIPRAE